MIAKINYADSIKGTSIILYVRLDNEFVFANRKIKRLFKNES